ncbi:MAG: hypothetical protein HGA53_01840 [Anaerolineaceae bacterium]|nr:hypothetical protein [Anaerolineaceae bacterium]NTV35673.1 hypothetical protein [Anaerolineaceae bacterium]
MLTEINLREMLAFTAAEPVLSVYLNTEPTSGTAETHKLKLRTLLKDTALPEDVNAIERYLDHEYNWSGRGVAIFSCVPKGFFRAYPVAIPVLDMVHVGERPSLKPLAEIFDNYGGYGVVLLDKQGARLFFFHLGELREQEGYIGDPVKHTKQGGSSSVHGQRGGTAGQTHYADELVDRNMKEIAARSSHFFEENHIRRILIGGSDDNVAQFRSMLAKNWQSLVVGTFRMNMNASQAEVLAEAMQIGLHAEQQKESRLIDELITTARKDGLAVLGLEDTLKAVNEKRVSLLMVANGYRKAGYACKACHALTLDAASTCAICGGEVQPAADVVDAAVNVVLRSNGDVEVASESPALESAGRILARLRY